MEDFPELTNIRTTLNNNIKISATTEKIQQFTEILENSEKIKNVTTIVNPETRKMKILLLRIPTDIQESEIEAELKTKVKLNPDSFTIIQTEKGNSNNWIIELDAKDCRKLTKQKTIRILMEKIRVVHHIRVVRCTNCQAFNDHTKSTCKYNTQCANCAGRHLTDDCTETKQSCINCIRYRENAINHRAFDPECPIYRLEKEERLKNYYRNQNQQSAQDQTSNMELNFYNRKEQQNRNNYITYSRTDNKENRKDNKQKSQAESNHDKRTKEVHRNTQTDDEDEDENVIIKHRTYYKSKTDDRQKESRTIRLANQHQQTQRPLPNNQKYSYTE